VLLRVGEEREQNFVHAHAGVGCGSERDPVGSGFKFEVQSGERGPGLVGVVRAGEQLLLPDPESIGPHRTGAAGLFVERVGRDGITGSGHLAEPPRGFCGMIPQNPSFGSRARNTPG
jgi:hypothetical protein